ARMDRQLVIEPKGKLDLPVGSDPHGLPNGRIEYAEGALSCSRVGLSGLWSSRSSQGSDRARQDVTQLGWRISEIRTVQDIKQLRSELNRSKLPDGDPLRHGYIGLNQVWAFNGIA